MILERLDEDPVTPALSMLARLSQHLDLGEDVLAKTREICGHISIDFEDANWDNDLKRLGDGCMISAAQRDEALAHLIADSAVRGASSIKSDFQAVAILKHCLIAGAAFENEDAWSEWLEECLATVAGRLRSGEASKAFLEHLNEVKKATKHSHSIFARAEALASAAN